MHLKSISVQNFRRLKRAQIDMEQETSIFVGSNNSGKTSATYVLHRFLDPNSKSFSIHDFSSDCWKQINAQAAAAEGVVLDFPVISLDLWFEVGVYIPMKLTRVFRGKVTTPLSGKRSKACLL